LGLSNFFEEEKKNNEILLKRIDSFESEIEKLRASDKTQQLQILQKKKGRG
jgi:hypothetical protein